MSKGYSMVDCVNLGTLQYFEGNPIADALHLRYLELVKELDWANVNVQPNHNGCMEFDQFDTPATQYLLKRSAEGIPLVTGRVKPTTIPYMLSSVFKDLLEDDPLHLSSVVEGSRIVVNDELKGSLRRNVVNEILISYMECALYMGADKFVAFMLPKVWETTFVRIGWEPEWLGPESVIEHSGEVVRAGVLRVNNQLDRIIRKNTGLEEPLLNFGSNPNPSYAGSPNKTKHEEIIIKPTVKSLGVCVD